MNGSVRSTILFTVAGLVILLMLGLCFSECTPSGSCAASDPSLSVDGFFTALSEQDEQAALGYLYNCDSLGMDMPENDIYAAVYNELCTGRIWQILDTEHLTSTLCRVSVRCEYLNIELIQQQLTQTVLEDVYEMSADGTVFDDEYDYSSIILTHLSDISQNFSGYYTSETLEIELAYSNGKWQIVLTDELYDLLAGR